MNWCGVIVAVPIVTSLGTIMTSTEITAGWSRGSLTTREVPRASLVELDLLARLT